MNVNPAGPSPRAVAAACKALSRIDAYPDRESLALVRALARAQGIPEDTIVCGAGASDIIWRLAAAVRPKRLVVCAPTFSEYAEAASYCGACVQEFPLSDADDFDVPASFAHAIEGPGDVAYLCNPNNPTGRLVDPRVIDAAACRCEQTGALLVVDECFLGFAPDARERSVAARAACSRHVAVLSAFTKLYGMAGLRLGYLISGNAQLIEGIRRAGQAWPVSSVAEAAGIAALEDVEYVSRTRDVLAGERAWLSHELSSLGLSVVPSDANFLLVRTPAKDFPERLYKQGVLVRTCDSFSVLSRSWCRVAVRTRKENARLVMAFSRALRAEGASGEGEPDERGWMRVLRDGKWGILRQDGEVIVPCAYNLIGEPNAYGLIPVTSDGKHGFLGADGREVLPCFFSYISDFKDGYARTNYGGSMVLRDEPYGGQWGLIDTLGHETIPCRYYYLDTPGEGLAAFRLEQFGNYGYVDVKGNVAISPRFSVARPFSGGVAVVSYNNVNFGLVDRNGGEVSSFRYKRIGRFNDGLAPFNTDLYGMNFQGMEPRCGYIDTEGREVIPAKWDDAAEFSEMRAAVMRFGTNAEDFYDARWGYIATNGQLVVPLKYHEAYPFSCGLARVFIKGLGYGYIDRQGNEVVPCKYQEAEDFHDFRAKVKQYDRVLTIDETGQIVEQ